MKNEKIWITKEGEEIPYNKLTTNHLINILKWIEKKAEEGIPQCSVPYVPSWWKDGVDCEIIYGEQVLKKYDYIGLKQELEKRKSKKKKKGKI